MPLDSRYTAGGGRAGFEDQAFGMVTRLYPSEMCVLGCSTRVRSDSHSWSMLSLCRSIRSSFLWTSLSNTELIDPAFHTPNHSVTIFQSTCITFVASQISSSIPTGNLSLSQTPAIQIRTAAAPNASPKKQLPHELVAVPVFSLPESA